MAYSTTRIDRRNLVRLAGWGMTGLRPPGRGNLQNVQATSLRATEAQASTVQGPVVMTQAEPVARA